MRLTPDTKVVVHRQVTVSTEHTIGDLAKMVGEDPEKTARWFKTKALANHWLAENRLAEMVPTFDSTNSDVGDTLDSDNWFVTVSG